MAVTPRVSNITKRVCQLIQSIAFYRWLSSCWETCWTNRTSGELIPTWLRTGPRTRRCGCGRCRWWIDARWLNLLSIWPARWPSRRASPRSPSVATRTRAAAPRTAECALTEFIRKTSFFLLKKKGNLVLLKNNFMKDCGERRWMDTDLSRKSSSTFFFFFFNFQFLLTILKSYSVSWSGELLPCDSQLNVFGCERLTFLNPERLSGLILKEKRILR